MDSPSDSPQSTDSGYAVKQILERARKGRLSIYPFSDENNRFSIYGTDMRQKATRFPTLDDLLIVPPQFTPLRLEKAVDLIDREPTFHDVKTESLIGGFRTALPLVQASMGSPDEWNRVACHSAKACASSRLIYGIGENVTATWGYEKRKASSQPSFMDRVMAYLDDMTDGLGGVVIQQNEEDAYNGLWNRVYSDQKLDEHIQQGRIAFEIKGGKGQRQGWAERRS